jgi:hypothetical protein
MLKPTPKETPTGSVVRHRRGRGEERVKAEREQTRQVVETGVECRY